MSLSRRLAQFEALDFSGLGLRQGVNKIDRAWIFVGRDYSLDVILEPFGAKLVPGDARFEHDKGGNDLSALIVGRANDRALGYVGMRKQSRLHFRTGYIIAS